MIIESKYFPHKRLSIMRTSEANFQLCCSRELKLHAGDALINIKVLDLYFTIETVRIKFCIWGKPFNNISSPKQTKIFCLWKFWCGAFWKPQTLGNRKSFASVWCKIKRSVWPFSSYMLRTILLSWLALLKLFVCLAWMLKPL